MRSPMVFLRTRSKICGNLLLGDSLAGLAADLLSLVANAFAFVRLWLAERTNFSRKLTDALLVRSLNDDVRLIGACDFQVRRNWHLQLVRKSNAKLQLVTRYRGQVPHPD